MSRRMLKPFASFLLALSIASIGQTVSAGDPVHLQAKATKSISGTVVNVDNAPAIKADVALYSQKPKTGGRTPIPPGGNPTGDSVIGTPAATPLQKGGDTLVTKTQTDATGKFTFHNVAPGPYIVVAGTGRNAAKVNVDVKPDADPAPVSLKLPSK